MRFGRTCVVVNNGSALIPCCCCCCCDHVYTLRINVLALISLFTFSRCKFETKKHSLWDRIYSPIFSTRIRAWLTVSCDYSTTLLKMMLDLMWFIKSNFVVCFCVFFKLIVDEQPAAMQKGNLSASSSFSSLVTSLIALCVYLFQQRHIGNMSAATTAASNWIQINHQ
jgi:hypothetical protein